MITYGDYLLFGDRKYSVRLAKKKVKRFRYIPLAKFLKKNGAIPIGPIKWIIKRDYEVCIDPDGFVKCLAVGWKQDWDRHISL